MTHPPISIFLEDLAATARLGESLGRSLPAGTILLMEGDLGAGKTSLIQSVGKGLGITDAIVSPTFTLINEYHEGRLSLYHLDLYRLNPDHVEALYLENYYEGIEVPLGIVAIEWSERLSSVPEPHLKIQLSYERDGRLAIIQPVGDPIQNLSFLTSL